MKIVEISGKVGKEVKRYNSITDVSISAQPFSNQRISVLYGFTKGTDIVQTNEPTNILIDGNNNPIGNSEPVYFGIRVYPFISVLQDISCNNNIISYDRLYNLYDEYYFSDGEFRNRTLLPKPYTGELYPQPNFVESLDDNEKFLISYQQAMQQFVNDCVFPTKPTLDLPNQSQSSNWNYDRPIPYFSPNVYMIPDNEEPKGILCLIQDESEWQDGNHPEPSAYKDYMVQFDGQNLNFKFAMAVNSDFAKTPDIYLPFLYRTYVALIPKNQTAMAMGVIMQCLLYDSNGNVITG